MAQEKTVNGVDVEKLQDGMATLKQQPDLAKFRFRAHNQWTKGTQCTTTINDFYGLGQEMAHKKSFTLTADEPEVLVGTDEAPNATEALLYALTSCVLASGIYHAALRGVKLDSLEVHAEGELDVRGVLGLANDVRNGFQSIKLTFKISGDAPEAELLRICEIAQERSPVFDMVTHGVPVTADVQVAAPAGAGK